MPYASPTSGNRKEADVEFGLIESGGNIIRSIISYLSGITCTVTIMLFKGDLHCRGVVEV